MAAFLDHYWWAVFLFLIFVAAFVLRPATPRRHPAPTRDEDEESAAPGR